MRERAWRDKWKDPLEKAADKILESDRVNTYQKNKRAVLAALKEKADSLAEAAKHLIYFHMCELEGLAAGKPTPEQWMQAVRMVEENIAAYQASKEKP